MSFDKHITIEVRLLANLKKYSPPEGKVTVERGSTIEDLIEFLGVDHQLVGSVFADGNFTDRQKKLDDIKKISFLPIISGG